MATSLRLTPPFHPPHHRTTTTTTTTTTGNPNHRRTILCGPRDNRGPLHKGRTLSIEAINAVQTLKRTQRSNPIDNTHTHTHTTVTKTLSRLVKSDLIAAFNELLRQNHLDLALTVFSAIRSEHWYTADLNLYAKLVTTMANQGMTEEIDNLICEIEQVDVASAEGKGVVTLIKALIAAGRAEATVRVYEMMRSGGWRWESPVEEYVGRVLSRGLRRLGKKKVADEIDVEIGRVCGGVLEKMVG